MNKKVSRRSLLKYTAALAAGVVVGVGAEYGATYKPPPPPPPSFKPPLSPEIAARVDVIKQNLISRHQGETFKFTACSQNGCFGTCLLKARVKNGVVTAIENGEPVKADQLRDDATDQQMKQGYFPVRPCVMGRGWRQTLYNPDRLLHPMKNVGKRGDPLPQFVRISWDEALDTVAAAVKTTVQKYGPLSIKYGGTSGQITTAAWLGASSYGYTAWWLCSMSGHGLADQQVLGVPYGWSSGDDVNNFFNSKLIVGFGIDPMVTWYQSQYYLLRAKEMGIPMIIISPTYNLSAEVLADQWIPIRPNTDIAMLLAIANVMFKDDSYDKDFVSKFVEPTGFAKWKDYVTGVTAGPDGNIDRTPQWAEAICGVPAQTITEVARLVASTKPTYFRLYWSAARQYYCDDPSRAGIYICAMTGNVGIDGGCAGGGGYNVPRYVPMPSTSIGAKPSLISVPTSIYSRGWVPNIMNRDAFQSGQMTEEEYRRRSGNAVEFPMYNLHMLLSTGGASTMKTPDMNNVMRAYDKLDYVFTANFQAATPVILQSDIILPLADNFFESEPSWQGGARFSVLSSFYFQDKIVQPLGEARSTMWIDMQIAKRFMYDANTTGAQAYFPRMAAVLDNFPDGYDTLATQVLGKEAYQNWAQRADIVSRNPPSWDDFIKAPVYRVPQVDKPNIGFRDMIERGIPFNTPSGKMEFYNANVADPNFTKHTWKLPTTRVVAFNGGSGPGEAVTNKPSDTGVALGGTCQPMAMYEPPPNSIYQSPMTKTYPLYMLSSHSNYRQHVAHDNNLWFREEARHAVWISATDAQARGIKDGDSVRVYSDVGEAYMPAYVTVRAIPGVVVVRYGSWYEPAQTKTQLDPYGIDTRGMSNLLLSSFEYPHALGPLNCGNLVQVEKLAAGYQLGSGA